MNFNEKNLEKWIKIDLPNGKHLYAREHKEQALGEKESHVKSGLIRLNRKRILGRTSFILVDSKYDFECFIEFDLCDESARLVERKKETDLEIEEIDELKRFSKHFREHPGLALFTHKEKRGNGIAKELLYYGLLYLKKKGIDIVDIGSAANEDAKKFYRNNGAILCENSDFPKEFTNLEERIEELRQKLGMKNQMPISFEDDDSCER